MKLLQFLFLFLTVVIFGSYFLFGRGFNEWYVFVLSLVSVLNMLIFDFVARAGFRRRGLFCASTLFLISYSIVFFQFPLLAPFYEEIRFNQLLWMRDEFVNWTTMVSAGSIHLFMAGYIWGLTNERRKARPAPIAVASRDKLRVLLYSLPLASFGCFAAFMALVGRSYLSGAYGGSANWGAGATYLFRLFEVLFYLTIALEIYKIKQRKPNIGVIEYIFSFNMHTLAFIGFFFLFHLFTGDRGPVITLLLMLVGGYDLLFKRLPIFISIVAIVAGVFTLSFISAYRTKDASMTMEERIEKGKQKTKDKKFYEVTGDLAASVRIMNYAVMLTPEFSDYYFGWIQAGRVATSVPLAAKVFRKAIPIQVHQTPLGSTSSSIFTYHVLGPDSTIGVGSSILADLYIDFGIVGCFAGMALFGYFIAWSEFKASSTFALFPVVFYLMVVSTSIYWPRSFIGISFQQWVLTFGILYLIHKYFLGNYRVMLRPNLNH
jgi:hypothetical protein